MSKLKFNIIANSIVEPGMSGGNRIFIELAKQWLSCYMADIRIQTTDVGQILCTKNGLVGASFSTWDIPFAKKEKFSSFTIFFLYLWGLIKGIISAIKYHGKDNEIFYSSSDYWPDSVPAFLMKLKNKNSKWIAGFFLSAPKPWQKDSPYKGLSSIIGILFYLTQTPIYWLIKKYADFVFVTSEPDVSKFITKKRTKNDIVVVKGGVDTKTANEHFRSKMIIPIEKRLHDACFIGRFHPQKGVLELINIWQVVCQTMPTAKLAMIGNGPLLESAKAKAKNLKLLNNITFYGFKDGNEKYEIFQQSKIVVHPAVYDSGGMAMCEALAWGLPGISFDLLALKTYYPKGVIKTKCYNQFEFAKNILQLLENKKMYAHFSQEAIKLAQEWSWNKRSDLIFKSVEERFQE